MIGRPPATEISFWERTSPEPNTGCLLWTGSLFKNGYGQCRMRGECKAHRVSWVLTYGTIPRSKLVCHRCDIRSCVNPAHLFLGSQKDNIQDAVRKKRMAAQKKTHCSQGHIFEGSNLYIAPKTKARGCLICRRSSTKISDMKRKKK